MYLPIFAMCLLALISAAEPMLETEPLKPEEREVYLEVIRGAREGELGRRFPREAGLSVHHLAYISRYDTFLTFRPVPPVPDGYRDVISIWRKSWRGPVNLSELASDTIKMADFNQGFPSGCVVRFSHIGFDDAKERAVVLSLVGCTATDSDFAERLVVFMAKQIGQWEILDYRLVEENYRRNEIWSPN
jgi:hypothetical protein